MNRLDAEFDTFVLCSSPQLLRLAYRLTGDRQHAEDLLQASLLRVARQWHRARDNPVGYARRTLVNLATDRWRQRGRQPVEVGMVAAPERPHDDPESQHDNRQVLFAALRKLPPRQRAVLVLRFWEDLSVEQTAELLDCSSGNVKSTSHRALARIRAILQTEGATHG